VFYPDGLPQRKWLDFYSHHFDTVEVNNSFYRLPEKTTFESWRAQTPENFTFAVKASRYLTHIKRLREPEEPLQRLLDHSSGLEEKLGPILYQFPPGWVIDIPRLEAFLRMLPEGIRGVFEFRNESWHNDEVWALLSNYKAAYCIMDSPGLPLHLRTTTDFTYIRMHSGGEDTGSNYTNDHLTLWADRITLMLERGDVYVYFNNDYMGYAVRNAEELREIIMG